LIFEGSEKKLELVFTKKIGTGLLRNPNRFSWHKVVEASGARILSEMCNDVCTAYLLSESSLFVYEDRVILITCGRTDLMKSIKQLSLVTPLDQIKALLYQRRFELMPDLQPACFDEDVAFLHEYFPGQVHLLGPPDGKQIRMYSYGDDSILKSSRPTLELLMHDIDPAFCRTMKGDDATDKESFCKRVDFQHLLPDFSLDEYWFSPPGYSLNGIRKHDYYTLHITPQPEGSYISFESGIDFGDHLPKVVQEIIGRFQPKECICLIYGNDRDSVKLAKHVMPDYEIVQNGAMEMCAGFLVDYRLFSRKTLQNRSYRT